MRVVLITGISGSGKSIAINVLEDDGYFCIDNLPVRFLADVIASLAKAGHRKVAVSIDARSGESISGLRQTIGDTARVTEYAHQGVSIGLGTDWLFTGSMNMLRELSCADRFNQERLDAFFTDEQLWLMATRNNAEALGAGQALGVIAEGYVADLALYDASSRRDHRAVIEAKGGIEENAVVMSLINYTAGDDEDPSPCPPLDAYSDGQHIKAFTQMFEANGFVGGICQVDYGPTFMDAVGVINTACQNFIPPG